MVCSWWAGMNTIWADLEKLLKQLKEQERDPESVAIAVRLENLDTAMVTRFTA